VFDLMVLFAGKIIVKRVGNMKIFAAVLIVMGMVMSGCGESVSSVSADETDIKDESKITLSEFNELSDGISYSDAVSIIGGSGEVLSESNVSGINTVMYQWVGEGELGANANAMFQNDKLIGKAQYGLE
jgi:uncharacterized protein YceK